MYNTRTFCMKDKYVNHLYAYHLTVTVSYESYIIPSTLILCSFVHQSYKYSYIICEYVYGV